MSTTGGEKRCESAVARDGSRLLGTRKIRESQEPGPRQRIDPQMSGGLAKRPHDKERDRSSDGGDCRYAHSDDGSVTPQELAQTIWESSRECFDRSSVPIASQILRQGGYARVTPRRFFGESL